MDDDRLRTRRPRALNELGANFERALAINAGDLQPATRRRPTPQRWLRPAAITLAAVAVASAVLLIVRDEQTPVAVQDALAQVAQIASGDVAPPPGSFTYTNARISALHSDLAVVTIDRKAWISQEHEGRVETVRRSSNAQRRRRTRVTGKLPPAGDVRIAGSTIGETALATGAAAEYVDAAVDQAVARAKGEPDSSLRWRLLTEPLQAMSTPLNPRLRAALISELASVPGVESLGRSRDSLGRETVRFAFADEGVRQEIAFSADTGLLIESHTVAERDGAGPYGRTKAGTLIFSYKLLDAAIVSEVGERP